MKLSLEAKVGIFVIFCLIALGYMTTRVGEFSWFKGDSYSVKGYLKDAAGVTKDAFVKFKGVEVGKVNKIDIEEDNVVAYLTIDKKYKIPANVILVVRATGFLGEKYIELSLKENPDEELLAEGGTIDKSGESTDVDELTNKFGQVADDIKAITESLKDIIATPEGKDSMKTILGNFRDTSEYLRKLMEDNQNKISRIIGNVDTLTDSMKTLTLRNQENVTQLIDNLKDVSVVLKERTPGIAEQVDNVTADISEIMGSSKEDIKSTITQLEKSVTNIESITAKLDKGSGTLGGLINDNETLKNLNETLVSAKNMLGKIDDFKFYLSFSGESLVDTGETKGYFTLKIQPRKHKYYLLGIASDPYGKEKIKHTHYFANYEGEPPAYIGTQNVNYTSTESNWEENSITFIAQYAQRFLDVVDLRIGIMESEFGVGADYYPFIHEKLQFSFDAFDFVDDQSDRDVHLKAKVQYYLTKNLFVNIGYDDFLNEETRSTFIGGGLRFLDDDIKYLFGKIPVPIN